MNSNMPSTSSKGRSPRAPLYGGLLIVAAMIAATVVTGTGASVAIRVPVYVMAGVAALFGIALTLHDLH